MQTSANAPQRLDAIIKRNRAAPYRFLMVSIFLLPVVVIWAATSGAIQVNLFQLLQLNEQTFDAKLQSQVLFDIRLPRVLMTLATGAGLAFCGLILQSLFRNPLAEPGLLGVSSSAAFFAALGFYLLSITTISEHLTLVFIPSMAIIGAILAMLLLFAITAGKNKMNTLILILAGVAISAGSATMLGLITYLADDSTLRLITFWTMGSYSGISWTVSLTTLAVISMSYLYFHIKQNAYMLISVSESQARFQGVNTQRIKVMSLLLIGVVVAFCVSFTGIVGFVGLVVPHICRFLVGHHLKLLLPMSAIVGALLVAAADTVSRIIIIPAELPIGLLTSAIGVPFFIYLIIKSKA